MTRSIRLFICSVVLVPVAASAQTTSQSSSAVPIVPTVPAVVPVGSRVGNMSMGYDDGARRDPFNSLVTPRRSATPSSIDGARPRSGLASLSLADVTVTGISKVGDARLAILEGPNKQSFVVRPKDRLFDAAVLSIDAEGVIFSEQTDGNRATNQVRRSLRPAGEGIR